MSLVGKFLFYIDDEYHQLGEVVEQLTPDIVLIRWDKVKDPAAYQGRGMVAIAVSSFTEVDSGGVPKWEFYDTRAELDAFHDWLCKPSEEKPKGEKIVKLTPPKLN